MDETNTEIEILKIPKIPEEIKTAATEGNLVIFIGAGVSRLMGCASWDDLAYDLLKLCHEELKDGQPLINFAEKESLSKIQDNKQKITISYNILCANDREQKFWECMEKSFIGDKTKEDIYSYLREIRSIFVTTNADKLFDCHLDNKSIYNNTNVDMHNIKLKNLYHIHGMIDKRESVIFTVRRYIELYKDHDFKKFIEKLLSNQYIVLFIGYGLSEFELLDYIIKDIPKEDKDNKKIIEKNKFVLEPFNGNEKNLVHYKQMYYKDLGIKILPYNYDEIGYDQLTQIFKKWHKELYPKSNYVIEDAKDIEQLIHEFNRSEASILLKRMETNHYLRKVFYSNINKSIKPEEWLDVLVEFRHFNVKKDKLDTTNEDGFYTVPHWDAIEYLELVASKTNNDKILKYVFSIVSGIAKELEENNINNYRVYAKYFSILSKLSVQIIDNESVENLINFIDNSWNVGFIYHDGKELIKKLLRSNKSDFAFDIIFALFKYKVKDREALFGIKEDLIFYLESYYFKDLLILIKNNILDKDFELFTKRFINYIRKVEEDSGKINYIWINDIEAKKSHLEHDNEVQCIYFLKDILANRNIKKLDKIINNMLEHESNILRRIAIYIINIKYHKLGYLFWKDRTNQLTYHYDQLEVFRLLKNNAKHFSSKQIGTILGWIEDKQYKYRDDNDINEEIREKRIAHDKKEWLLAILESDDDRVTSMYDKYNSIYSDVIEHPGYLVWTESSFSDSRETELPFEEFIDSDNNTIVKNLRAYQPKDDFNSISKEDIAWRLRDCVKSLPEKFYEDLETFKGLDLIYIDAILSGFDSVADDKKLLDWGKILDYSKYVINSKSFSNYKSKDSIISTITYFINKGTADESYGLGKDLVELATEIIIKLDEITEENLITDSSKLYNTVFSNDKYSIYETMIYLSLKDKRVNKGVWLESIKKIFENKLSNNYTPTFAFVLGQNLRFINNLEKGWLEKNYKTIFDKSNDITWFAVMSGFYFRCSADRDIYIMFKENGDTIKALDTKFNEQINEYPPQHIAIAYINDVDSLNDEGSLVEYLVKNGSNEQLNDFIRVIDKIEWNSDISVKVEKLFKYIHKYKKDNYEVLSYLVMMLKYIGNVKSLEIEIIESVRCIKDTFLMLDYVDFCNENIDKYPNIIIQSLQAIARFNSNNRFCNMKQVHDVVRKLYSIDKKEANHICSLFVEKGYSQYKDIFEEYNNKLNKENDENKNN